MLIPSAGALTEDARDVQAGWNPLTWRRTLTRKDILNNRQMSNLAEVESWMQRSEACVVRSTRHAPMKMTSDQNGYCAKTATLSRMAIYLNKYPSHVVSDHSFRKATIGSTPAARRAGIADASSAARPSRSVVSVSMIGSHGLTPNS